MSIQLGNVGDWLSGIAATAAFAFALLVWRREHDENRRREVHEGERAQLSRAAEVNVWPQRGLAGLTANSHGNDSMVRDGWFVVAQNNGDTPVYRWHFNVFIDPPARQVEVSHEDLGPIPPYGRPLLYPLDWLSVRESPTFEGRFVYAAADGTTWERTTSGSVRPVPPGQSVMRTED